MTKNRKKQKKHKIKEIIPVLWEIYKHIYDVRDKNISNGINYLMIVATFLPIFNFMLYQNFDDQIFLLPIIFHFAALLILFKRFFISGKIPWLSSKEIFNNIDNQSIETELFSDIKSAEQDTRYRLIKYRRIIKVSLFLIVYSIFLTGLAFLYFKFRESNSLFYIVSLITFLFALILLFYFNWQEFDFDKEKDKVKDELKAWIRMK